MKVLFLDIDGVLNSMSWFAAQPPMSACEMDPKAVKRIVRVLETTGAKVVLSSSWRHQDELVDRIEAAGIPIMDKTPEIRDVARAFEIRSWLDEHPEVTTFAVIDDDADAGVSLEGRFVRTHAKHGMYGKHEKRLIELLGSPS